MDNFNFYFKVFVISITNTWIVFYEIRVKYLLKAFFSAALADLLNVADLLQWDFCNIFLIDF